jgi:hypothetical protein
MISKLLVFTSQDLRILRKSHSHKFNRPKLLTRALASIAPAQISITPAQLQGIFATTLPTPPTVKIDPLDLGPSLLPPLPFLIPQHPPQDLPTRTLRNDIHKLYPTYKPLMPCLLLLHMPLYIPREHLFVILQRDGGGFDDECLGDLTGAIVGDGDNGAVGDTGVVEETGFEFCGCDLEALYCW